MSSIFKEQIVKSEESRAVYIKRGLILAGAIALGAIILLIPAFFAFVPIFLFLDVFLAWYLWRNCAVEFEYYIGDEYMDVSKIYGKSKRKSIDSIHMRSIREISPVTKTIRELKREFNTVYDCTGSSENDLAVYYNGTGEDGSCVLLFSPNEKIIDALKLTVPMSAWKNV